MDNNHTKNETTVTLDTSAANIQDSSNIQHKKVNIDNDQADNIHNVNDNESKDNNKLKNTKCLPNNGMIKLEMFSDGSYKKHQSALAKSVQPLDVTATYEEFKSRLNELTWLSKTRYDLICHIKKLNETSKKTYSRNDILLFNDTIQLSQDHMNRGLYYHRLDKSTFQLVVFINCQHKHKNKFQLSFIIFLVDESNRCNWLRCSNYEIEILKFRRNRIFAELYCLLIAFDFVLPLRNELEKLIKHKVPLYFMTDCIDLCKILSNSVPLHERILKHDFQFILNACYQNQIQDIGYIKKDQNIAASFHANNTLRCIPLDTLLDYGMLKFKVEKWTIKRYKMNPSSLVREQSEETDDEQQDDVEQGHSHDKEDEEDYEESEEDERIHE